MYSCSISSLTAGVDYISLVTTLTFQRQSRGGTQINYYIPIIDDGIPESSEESICFQVDNLGNIIAVGDMAIGVIMIMMVGA